mgnify:CR=1 FL=1
MKYWLVKSEPFKYSWNMMLKDKVTYWDGVRNYQARNNLKLMKKGDLVLFYHSNEGKEIVGVTKVVKEYYQDPTTEDKKWVVVDLRVDKTLKKLGKDFIQLTGNDDNAFEFNKKGGVGAISVTANIAPKLCSDFQRLSKSNNDSEIKEAERLNKILQPVHHAMFVESNPSPVKYAAKLMNLCDDDVRLPLVKVTDSTKEIVKKAIEIANLIQ